MGERREDRLNADGLYGCAGATVFTATLDNDTYHMQPGDNLLYVKPVEAIARIYLPPTREAAGQWYNIVYADPEENYELIVHGGDRAGIISGWSITYSARFRSVSVMFYCNGFDWWRFNPITGAFEGYNVPE
jgi:hypothetical protein